MEENIRHDGLIDSINEGVVCVKILQISSCAACQVKSLCRISESKEKLIFVTVPDDTIYHVGQKVTVAGTSSQGMRAVVLAFGLPLVLVLAVLFVGISIFSNEGFSALLSLLVLVPYYIVLLLFRDRLKRVFQFRIIE